MYMFVNFQVFIHSNGLETLYQHVPRKILPNEYGGEAGRLDELHGRYSKAHCIVTDNIHSFSILSDDRSKASSKTIPRHSAI